MAKLNTIPNYLCLKRTKKRLRRQAILHSRYKSYGTTSVVAIKEGIQLFAAIRRAAKRKKEKKQKQLEQLQFKEIKISIFKRIWLKIIHIFD